MAHNRYFIIDSNDTNLDTILSYSVESKPRENNDKTKLVIKLFEDDHSSHAELANYTEYNHDAILTQMQLSEWINGGL